MAVTTLSAYAIPYPTITNSIRVDIYKQSDPNVVVATQTQAAPHPQRIWNFPFLPRTNYIFDMNEIDSLGNKISNLAYFDVQPVNLGNYLVRDDEQIRPGVTPGFDAGNFEAWFDGRETFTGSGIFHPDFRGWNINPERRNQPGTMLRDIEYYWDETNGYFRLQQMGDVFLGDEPYNIDFDPKQIVTGVGTPIIDSAFTAKLITSNYNILIEDFGNKLIVEPIADFITLTLPSIVDVTQCLPLEIEVDKDSDCCVQIVQQSGEIIKFMRGKIFACRKEYLRIYKFVRNPTTPSYEWRVDKAEGNFKDVGKIVWFNSTQAGLYNCMRLYPNQSLNVDKYRRLYDYVELLKTQGLTVTYDNWTNNKTKFSESNGTEFRIPDYGGLYLRASQIESSGYYWRMQIEKHKHIGGFSSSQSSKAPYGFLNLWGKLGSGKEDHDNTLFFTNDGLEVAGGNQLNTAGAVGDETRPNSVSINQYILL